VAYAAGDALGLPWEGEHPSQIDPAVVESLPKRGDWPPGSTSDDTALTLLVGEYLIQEQGVGNPLDFMELVSNRADSIRGMGPSTSKAVQYFRDTHSLYEGKSNTNGAPMKALPIGWALPLSAAEDRRKWTLALSSATHGGGDALCSACVVAACASWALEGLSPRLLVEVALEEARAIAPSVCQTGSDVVATLEAVKEDAWTPPADGISLDPAPTLGAVLYCCLRSRDSLRESLLMAVSLGGDTDTVAALVGGLLGCRKGIAAVERELPWLSRVDLPDRERLASIASGLAAIRIRHYG